MLFLYQIMTGFLLQEQELPQQSEETHSGFRSFALQFTAQQSTKCKAEGCGCFSPVNSQPGKEGSVRSLTQQHRGFQRDADLETALLVQKPRECKSICSQHETLNFPTLITKGEFHPALLFAFLWHYWLKEFSWDEDNCPQNLYFCGGLSMVCEKVFVVVFFDTWP